MDLSRRPTNDSFTVRVGTPIMHSDKVYYPVNGYGVEQLLVRLGEQDGLVYLDEEHDREILLTSFQPFEGGFWNAPGRVCEQEGQTQLKHGEHNGPGGYWPYVLEIKYRSYSCADAGVLSEQYAENIGMLRRVNNTIAGPRTYDLVYARLGNQVIDSSQRGRFTAAIVATHDDRWDVALRLDLGTSPALSLRFPTAQEYEVVLRDAAGTAVWTWSYGQAFVPAFHEKVVSGEWIVDVSVPCASSSLAASGPYTIEGWLTTQNDSPRFAATVPVVVPTETSAAVHRQHPIRR